MGIPTQPKLTDDEVLQIRRDYKPRKTTMKDLAARYNVGVVTIYRVIKGQRYAKLQK